MLFHILVLDPPSDLLHIIWVSDCLHHILSLVLLLRSVWDLNDSI